MHLHSSKSQSQKFGLPKIAAMVGKTWKQLGNDEWLQEMATGESWENLETTGQWQIGWHREMVTGYTVES